jgi:hypothetical protein
VIALLLASAAAAAPVLEAPDTEPTAPWERCVADAEGEVDDLPAVEDLGGDRVAVVVGVPCHRSEAIPSLRYASRDAARVTEALRAGGFTVLPLLTVVDRATLLDALDAAARAVSPEGTLVVYFSGHGVLREEGGELRRYLVLSDTELTAVGSSGLAVRDLEARLGEVPAAARVLVQDTCFAHRGGGKSVVPPALTGERAKGLLPLEPPVRPAQGELRLYASRLLEQATESVALRGSVYTAHLLDALAEPASDLDGDGCTGLLEAHAWARDRTVDDRGGLQVPISTASGAPNVVLGCDPAPAAWAVVDRPADDRLRVQLVGPEGGAVAVPGGVEPGRYGLTVQRWSTSGGQLVPLPLFDGPIRLRAGEWLDLEQALAERGPRFDLRGIGGWAASRTLPRALIGAEGVVGLRDRGWGRPSVGLALRIAPGPGPDAVAKRTVDLLAVGGWSVRLPVAGLEAGPRVAAGGVLRVPTDRGSPQDAPSAWGLVVEPALALIAGRPRGSARLGVGARLVPVERADRVRLDAAPVVVFGAGPRW